ncbi:hypothetical protein BY458DRAFT_184750 [Sporodiniella umbellata]|nr:hypothetical protein BY458DRAFT_184750 [Sporodiniella umbellata]
MNRNFHQYSTSTPMFTVTASPVSFNNNRIQSGTHEPINRRHSNHVSQQKIHRKPVPSLNSVPQPARNEKEVYLVNEANFKENIPPPTGVHSQKGRNSVLPVEKNTSFWYPRTGKENEPLKRNIGKKLRGLLQPQRAQLEEASRWQHEADSKISLCRSQTPEPENCQLNPFQTLRLTLVRLILMRLLCNKEGLC